MDNTTPAGIPGPSKRTIDYIRTFARLCRPTAETQDGILVRSPQTVRLRGIAAC